MNQWVVGLAAACVVSASAVVPLTAAGAQQPPEQPQAQPQVQPQTQVAASRADGDEDHLSEKARRLLARPVTIRLSDVPQRRAIDLVAENAGVHVGYRLDLVRGPRTVTLNVTNAPLSAVFDQMLAGTSLRLTVLPGDQLAVVTEENANVQATGTIVGTLRDAAGAPIANARVALRGTSRVAESKANGRFVLLGVQAGEYIVAATRLGYTPSQVTAKVTGTDTTFVTIVMQTTSTRLTEVVTTATGSQERFKVGNDVGTINADSLVQNTLVRNMSDLLTGHAPGVQVTASGGTVGAPSKIRIRGVESSQLNNDPIVVIDGVRVNAQTTVNQNQYFGASLSPSQVTTSSSTMPGVFALAPSPLDQIDPNNIESIDVLKGPTATALYGPDASTGVIVIKTKAGKPGPWRYHVGGDYGMILPVRQYPLIYTAWSRPAAGGASQPGCILTSAYSEPTLSNGGCLFDSVTAFNALNNREMTTLGNGYSHSLVADASGGGSTVQGFLQGDYDDALGQQKLSDVEQRRLARMRTVATPSWMIRPNAQQNMHVTSRIDAQFTPTFDVSASGIASYQNTRSDGSGLTSPPTDVYGPSDTLVFLPGEQLGTRATSTTKRGVGSTNARFQPWSWLVLTGTGGLDYSLGDAESLQRPGDCTVQINSYQCGGQHRATHTEIIVPSFTTGATFTYNPTSWLSAHTAVGEQFSRIQTYAVGVSASGLSFGQDLITGASTINVPTESTDETASAGWYGEQQVGFNERLFLTAALRRDVSSSFGRSASTPTFPKFGASWLVSNEPFFPHQSVVTQFRVRAAYGESGKQGAQTDVLRSYQYSGGVAGGSRVPVLVLSGTGNTQLEPQRDGEWEGGFDLSFYNDRATVTATWYRKKSKNAILSVNLPPSLGAGIPLQSANVGDVQNRGYELELSLRPVDTRFMTWSFNLAASANANKLLRNSNLINLPSGGNGRIVPGYPLFGLWERPILAYNDADGDGILESNEIVFADSAVFVGATDPKGSFNYANSLTFLGGRLSFNSLVSQVNGLATVLTQYNARGEVDPHASLAEQAAALQAFGTSTYTGGAGGFMGQVSYVSLAELSASFTLPDAWAQRFHSRSATVTVAGRNLALWTNYRGADPMVNTSALYGNGFGDGSSDNGTGIAQPKNWVVRFNLQF